MPTILIATVMVAGIFAFMPIEKAITVHTTIQSTVQGSQLNQFATVTVLDTAVSNATGGCGAGNQGLAYWTVMNRTLSDITTTGVTTATNSTFMLTVDGDTDDADEIDILLSANQTTTSGIVAIIGTTASDIIIGAPRDGSNGANDVGSILLSIHCQSGDSPTATAPST